MAAPIYVHVPLRRTNNACERKRSARERIFVVALNEFHLQKFCSIRNLSCEIVTVRDCNATNYSLTFAHEHNSLLINSLISNSEIREDDGGVAHWMTATTQCTCHDYRKIADMLRVSTCDKLLRGILMRSEGIIFSDVQNEGIFVDLTGRIGNRS